MYCFLQSRGPLAHFYHYSTAYTYDSLDRGITPYVYGTSGSVLGKLVAMTYPSGNQLILAYNAMGQVNSISPALRMRTHKPAYYPNGNADCQCTPGTVQARVVRPGDEEYVSTLARSQRVKAQLEASAAQMSADSSP